LSILKGLVFVASDLVIEERPDCGLATVMLRNGVAPGLLSARLELNVPLGPTVKAVDGFMLLGTGPGMWMAVAENAGSDWVEALQAKLKGIASVSDQTGAYVVFRISGAEARSILQKGVHIDLDEAAFGPGSVATTVVAHIGIVLWQSHSVSSFDVALVRSFSHSFRAWLGSVTTG
jgi:methylglutamate dehydrogenase subunit D